MGLQADCHKETANVLMTHYDDLVTISQAAKNFEGFLKLILSNVLTKAKCFACFVAGL